MYVLNGVKYINFVHCDLHCSLIAVSAKGNVSLIRRLLDVAILKTKSSICDVSTHTHDATSTMASSCPIHSPVRGSREVISTPSRVYAPICHVSTSSVKEVERQERHFSGAQGREEPPLIPPPKPEPAPVPLLLLHSGAIDIE